MKAFDRSATNLTFSPSNFGGLKLCGALAAMCKQQVGLGACHWQWKESDENIYSFHSQLVLGKPSLAV